MNRGMLRAGAVILVLLAGIGLLYVVRAQTQPAATSSPGVSASTPTAAPPATSSSTAAAVTATPPAKPTPCPSVASDPAKTGVEGLVTWDGEPVAGVRVEIRATGAPSSGPVEATATTSGDGRYRITGAIVGRTYGVAAPAQSLFVPSYGPGFSVCADEIARVAPLALQRRITGASVRAGDLLTTGTPMFQWDPVLHATSYCIAVAASTGPAFVYAGCPAQVPGTRTTTPSFSSPALASGRAYQLVITALHDDAPIGALSPTQFAVAPIGLVGPCATAAFAAETVTVVFFRLIDGGQVFDMATCWSDATQNRLDVMRMYAATGGADNVRIGPATPTASGAVAVEVRLDWRETAPLGWTNGQTKWLIVRKQGDGRWAIESVATALAPAQQ